MATFNETDHTCFNEEGQELTSVTTLLKIMGIAPDYSSVNEQTLKAKASRGTMIHKEIEMYIKENARGFSVEQNEFEKWANKNNVKFVESEKLVSDERVLAGTLDLIYVKDEKVYISDIKTTSTIHKEAVSWQLSIYLYLYDLQEREYSTIGDLIKQASCIHFDSNGELHEVEIPLKPREEVERLIACYITGMKYTNQTATTYSTQLVELYDIEKQIVALENTIKLLTPKRDEVREKVKALMKEAGQTTLETPNLKFTIVSPSRRVTINSKKLKSEHPEIYDQYAEEKMTAESLRVVVKETQDNV